MESNVINETGHQEAAENVQAKEAREIAANIAKLADRVAAGNTLLAGLLDQLQKSADMDNMIRLMASVRAAKDAVDESKKKLEALYGLISSKILPELMRDKKVKTTTLMDVGRITVAHRVSASMLDKQIGMNWLREHSLGDLIQETVNSSTLAAAAKEAMEGGNDFPDDIFKVSINPYVSITKVK